MTTYQITAERIPPDKITVDCRRPDQLFRYSEAKYAKRSLELGEFRLRPAADYNDLIDDPARHDDELVRHQSTDGAVVKISVVGGRNITPIGDVHYRSEIHTNYLVACFSSAPNLFTEFPDTDACLMIDKVEEFCERLYVAAESQLPDWVGADASVSYGCDNPLGVVFSKPLRFYNQREFRFGWQPRKPVRDLRPTLITIGNIEHLGHIVAKP